jgi:HAD superfamily phosphatase
MKTDPLQAIVVFDIDGVVRDVSNSYRRAIADTVEKFTDSFYRPTMTDIDELKSEGIWNNDWEASQELIYRYQECQGKNRDIVNLNYQAIVDFFQERYRGKDQQNFDGYITSEPLLMSANYLEHLSQNKIGWGFFSGATRGSAEYILKQRLGLKKPVLIAMEDAPGKPNPEGLLMSVARIIDQETVSIPVIYVGDTVGDMHTVTLAKKEQPNTKWIGVGVLPSHVQKNVEQQAKYQEKLKKAGAVIVLNNVEELNFNLIASLV